MSEQTQLPQEADSIDDPSIPLLTDRIYLPAVDLDTALPAPAVREAPTAAPIEPAAGLAEAPIEAELDRDVVTASDADFEALLSAEQQLAAAASAVEPVGTEAAHDASPAEGGGLAAGALRAPEATGPAAGEAAAEALRTAVLQRVAARLPERVDAALRELMQPAIEQAMARLGEEAEVALRITLQELIEQALRDEMADRRGQPHS